MKRRPVSPFSLSFLDIMFCGFGAVVLLVLILNYDTVQARNAVFADLRSEVVRLEQEVIVGRENMVAARNTLDVADNELVTMQGEAERVIETIRKLEIEVARMENETLANQEHVNALASDLKTLDKEQRRLGAPKADDRDERQQGPPGQGGGGSPVPDGTEDGG